MDAKDLVRAMIAKLANVHIGQRNRWTFPDEEVRADAMFDMVAHAAEVAFGYDGTQAVEFVSEELQERIVAMAD